MKLYQSPSSSLIILEQLANLVPVKSTLTGMLMLWRRRLALRGDLSERRGGQKKKKKRETAVNLAGNTPAEFHKAYVTTGDHHYP